MGNCMDPSDGYSEELPLHTVTVSAFYMDKYDVTLALWQQVYNWATIHGYSFDNPGSGKAANHPVQTVDWYDCVKWCNARSEMEGRVPAYYTSAAQTMVFRTGQVDVLNDWVKWNSGYRLPTEAEWEKAARGGASGQRFPWGNTISWSQANYYASPSSYAYDVSPTSGYDPTFNDGKMPYTSPVDYFAPNGYGLYDMAGNVWQWCWDGEFSYSSGAQTDPRGPTSGADRVLRGGSWNAGAGSCRSAMRGLYAPALRFGFNNIGFRSVLLSNTGIGPSIMDSPHNVAQPTGGHASFVVSAAGTPPLAYQWRKNGADIPGATAATLTLNFVTAADAGNYSVVVRNAYGFTQSQPASLAVLDDGANGTQPAQLFCAAPTTQQPQQNSLVVVTHGWQPTWDSLGPPPIPAWVTEMVSAIQTKVAANWGVSAFDWTAAAWTPDPDLALIAGAVKGTLYGKQLSQQHWQHVHLIGHSAGVAVIEAIAKQLKSAANPPTVQTTFLDPYTEFVTLAGRDVYGANADWSDCYFAQDWTGPSTGGKLEYAYNVDVTWVDPNKTVTPLYCGDYTPGSPDSTPAAAVPCGEQASSSHDWPHDFYLETVLGTAPACAAGYGFALSKEIEGDSWLDNRTSRPAGLDPVVLCGQASVAKNSIPLNLGQPLPLSVLPNATSASGVSLFGNGATLSSYFSSPGPQSGGGGGHIRKDGSPVSTNAASWLAMAVTVTNPVNFVTLDAGFSDTNGGQGLMTVYWNTNEIGMVDERVASVGPQTYRFALPGTLTNGLYTLSLRLDAFTNVVSSITVRNVATGFVGVPEPLQLQMVLWGTNSVPVLKLTGATGYNYLLQNSTNLVDWTPAAVLVNTNGTAFYPLPAGPDASPQFYRAVIP